MTTNNAPLGAGTAASGLATTEPVAASASKAPRATRRGARWAGLMTAALVVAALVSSCRSGQSVDAEPVQQTTPPSFQTDEEAARLLPQALDEYQARLYRESEAHLAECMGAAGFQYEPGDPLEDGYQDVPSEIYAMAPDDFVAEYGWGYSTLIYLPHGTDPSSDPNVMARDALAPADQTVWDETLGQCTQQLEQTAAGDTYEFVQFRSAQQIGLGIYAQDPRVTAEYQRWSSCLAEAGIEGLQTPLDVENEIRDAMATLTNQAASATGVTAEDVQAMPEYATIVARERDIASASLACDFPPPLLQRNEVLNPVLIESLRAGLTQYDESGIADE